MVEIYNKARRLPRFRRRRRRLLSASRPPTNMYLVYICTNIYNRFTLVFSIWEQQKHICTVHGNGQKKKNKERTIPSFRGICVDLDLWWDTVLCVEMWAGEHFLGIKKTPRLCTFVGDKDLHREFFNASGLTGKLPWLLGNSTVSSTDVPNHRSEPPTPP